MTKEEMLQRYGCEVTPEEQSANYLPTLEEIRQQTAEFRERFLERHRKSNPPAEPSMPRTHGAVDKRRAGVTVQ